MGISGVIKNITDVIEKTYYCLARKIPLRTIFLCDILCMPRIQKGTIFPHPYGISIHGNTFIGKRTMVLQGVTIGVRRTLDETTIIGDNVFIGCNSTILGNVTVGDNSIIGAHSLILHDVPAGKTVSGVW